MLYSLLGATYGGDGVNNFALPDFRGRVPLGMSAGFSIGQKDGIETALLSSNNLPAHSHKGQIKCANRSDSESPAANLPGTAVVSGSSTPRNKYVPAAGQTW